MKKHNIPYNKLCKTAVLKLFGGLLTFLFTITAAQFSSRLIQYAINQKTSNLFSLAVMFIIFIVFFQLAINYFNILKNKKEAIEKNNFLISAYKLLFQQNIHKTAKLTPGEIKERFTKDIDKLSNFITDIIPLSLTGIITSIIYLVYVSSFNIFLGLIIFALSFSQLIPPYFIKKYLQQHFTEAAEVGEEWMNFVISAQNGLSTIKTNNLKKWYTDKFNKINAKNIDIYKRNFIKVGQKTALNNAINAILTYGTHVVIGMFVFQNKISLEQAVIVVVICNNFYQNTGNFYSSITEFFVVKKAIERIKVFLPNKKLSNVDLKETTNIFEISNLNFSYDNNVVFEKLNLSIPKNTLIGIKGKNGSGKTTLIKLMLGIEKDKSNSIKFKGNYINNIPEEQLYDNITYIPQTDPLFNLSPKEILNMIEKTSEYNSKTSNLIQMFSINNNVLNSENFSNLSGGERKKISLIGGLIQDSSVIILDEPTNSLDKDSVKQLSKILLDIGKTVIIITHNNSLIKLCDKIFDIDLKNSSERNLGELI